MGQLIALWFDVNFVLHACQELNWFRVLRRMWLLRSLHFELYSRVPIFGVKLIDQINFHAQSLHWPNFCETVSPTLLQGQHNRGSFECVWLPLLVHFASSLSVLIGQNTCIYNRLTTAVTCCTKWSLLRSLHFCPNKWICFIDSNELFFFLA